MIYTMTDEARSNIIDYIESENSAVQINHARCLLKILDDSDILNHDDIVYEYCDMFDYFNMDFTLEKFCNLCDNRYAVQSTIFGFLGKPEYDMTKVSYSEIPDYADVFEIDEFLTMAEYRYLMSSDGIGYYVVEKQETDIPVRFYSNLSDYTPPNCTEVSWYNK